MRGKIRQNLRKYVNHGEMIGRRGQRAVSIPIPSLDVPRFKFGKNGSTVTTAAIKLARAYTNRDLVAMVEGAFNSFNDWGIASTPMTSGIPKSVLKMTKTFEYNNTQ